MRGCCQRRAVELVNPEHFVMVELLDVGSERNKCNIPVESDLVYARQMCFECNIFGRPETLHQYTVSNEQRMFNRIDGVVESQQGSESTPLERKEPARHVCLGGRRVADASVAPWRAANCDRG